MHCERPFVVFCSGHAGYFFIVQYRRIGKRKQEDAILGKCEETK